MDGKEWGLSSFNFRISGCAWCHPGGGPLEYDRDGYRYDGIGGGLGVTGLNPMPGNGDYYVLAPEGFSNKFGASGKGVAEADCMMCHYGERYNNVNRNFCMTKPGSGLKGTAFANAASLGLTGANGGPAEVLTTQLPAKGVNPSCDILGYVDGLIEADKILGAPKKENCANCHFADGKWTEPGPASTGTTNTPLGFTTFQKILNPGSFIDSDTNAPNTGTYIVTKGKSEFGKRAESINVAHNPDVHMDKGMNCVDCHYLLEGTFPALTDGTGNVVVGPVTAWRVDHQFAKGNNIPDGKNMDQFDNTVTCESCHVTWTHPNLKPCASASGYCMDVNHDGTIDPLTEDVPDPSRTSHVGMPALHFKKIGCRTCHIHEQNFKKKETVADFSSTPYPMEDQVETGGEFTGIGRGQDVSNPTGIHYIPLRMWRCREHNCAPGDMKIMPMTTTMVPVWKDLSTNLPYNKRFPSSASQKLRQVMSGRLTAPFSWTLNSPQGGDTGLIINRTTEIQNMVTILKGGIPAGSPTGFTALPASAQLAEPALNLFLNTFDTSHNTTKTNALGSGGCGDCHSAGSTFFHRQHAIFEQPKDGGLQMTCDNGDCSKGTKRISAVFSFPCPDGKTAKIDITTGKAHGQNIDNFLNQSSVLCYSTAQLAALTAGTPVKQKLGLPDTLFSAVTETDCRYCHGPNPPPGVPVNPMHLADRHHMLYGKKVLQGVCSTNTSLSCSTDATCQAASAGTCRGESVAPYAPAANGTYDCLTCHSVTGTPGSFEVTAVRNCALCHKQAPGEGSIHHSSAAAQSANCKACHGSFVNNPNDGHFIATTVPSLVTPAPGWRFNPDPGLKGEGSCDFCHVAGSVTSGIVGNYDTHHVDTGFGADPAKCVWCHLSSAPSPSDPKAAYAIRACENCHGVQSLHNIQADSNGDGTIYPSMEQPGFGHIGNNTDCYGCHGYYTAASTAPYLGPVVPQILKVDTAVISAGTAKTITITGGSLTNINPSTGNLIQSSIALQAHDNSVTNLTPVTISENKISVNLPATLAPGNYDVRAVKVDQVSNPLVIAIKPQVVISSVISQGGDVVISGSGFAMQPAGSEGFINVKINSNLVQVVSWSDTRIVVRYSGYTPGTPVSVSSVYGAASTTAAVCTDMDLDGYAIEGADCGPIDCDDTNPAINPGAVEVCADGVDNNCNGLTDAADPACGPTTCTTNSQCGTNQFCKKTAGNCSGTGTCQALPTSCLDINSPVCGCDGVTYQNSCIAELKGVNVASTGACGGPGKYSYYFPSIKDDSAIGWENYLTVQAKDPVSMDVSINVYDMNGTLAGTYIYSNTDPAAKAPAIAPYARVAQRPCLIASGIGTTCKPVEGSMVVETNVPAIATTNTIANFFEGFSIYEAAKPRSVHNFPKAFDGPNNYQVYMLVQNIYSTSQKVTAKLFGKTATSPGHGITKSYTIPAYGTLKFRPSDLAGGIDFSGSVVVTSDGTTSGDGLGRAVPAMCRYELGKEAMTIYESTMPQPALYFPNLKDGKFGSTKEFQNYLSVVNPNTVEAKVEVTLYSNAGVKRGSTGLVVLPPDGKATWRPSMILGTLYVPIDFEGSIVVTTDVPVVGQTNTMYPGLNIYSCDAFDLFESAIPASTLFFPKAFDNIVATGYLYDNFVYVQNPNATAKNIKIEQFNNNGTVNGVRTVSLAANSTYAYRPKDLVTDGTAQFRGSVRITETNGQKITGSIKYELHQGSAASTPIDAMTFYRSMGM